MELTMLTEDVIAYDIETVPDDETLAIAPPRPNAVDEETLVDWIDSRTINQIKVELPRLSLSELRSLQLMEESEKARSTLIATIKSEITNLLEGPTKLIKAASVDPWRCKIVAISMYDTRKKASYSLYLGKNNPNKRAGKPYTEEDMLIEWGKVTENRRRITWGGSRFDEQVIIARSLILDVKLPPIDISPAWKNTQHTDISMLCGNQALKTVAKRLQFPVASEMDGSLVYQAYKMKRLDEISKYCNSDVELLLLIAEMLQTRIITD
jgi:hypothetical protein